MTSLQYPLKHLSFDDLQPLWPEIAYRVEHRLSENVMFAGMQAACIDLMAEHKVEEGLRLTAYFFHTQNGWGSGGRNKQVLTSLLKYGVHAKRALFPMQLYLQKDMGFSEKLQTFKAELAKTTDKPELQSISKWLGDYQVGDHLEKLITMRELRLKIAKDDLAAYWKVYEMLQTLLKQKPDWDNQTKTVLDELMATPRAKEIVGAHLAINDIKQAVIDGKMKNEDAIAKLIQYRDTYDINDRGPNLVYWYSLMWSDRLKAGKKLK